MTSLFAFARRWDRFSADDERGALNLLTPERTRRAAGLVVDGTMISCGRDLAVRPAVDSPTPALHHMVVGGDVCQAGGPDALQASMDFVGVAFHGMAVSHIGALCHVFVDGQMYSGHPASAVTTKGAPRRHRCRLRRSRGPGRADRPCSQSGRRLARAGRRRHPRRADRRAR
ncbi:MAG: hypothetical protein R2695_08675 [Acidimicrobiales bacterium]